MAGDGTARLSLAQQPAGTGGLFSAPQGALAGTWSVTFRNGDYRRADDRVLEASSLSGLSSADIAAIRTTSARWVAAVRAGRWEDAAHTFTEDAILRFPDASYEGRAAILKFFQAMPAWSSGRVLHIDEIQGRGDMAFVTGHSTVTPEGGGPPVVVSRYLDIRLRKPDGTWLFYRDMVSPVPPLDSKRE